MRKGDESRKKIIDAAERLFDRKGYVNTSVQDILDVLGMSKGGFYHYFDTKLELLREVCSRRVEAWYIQGSEYVRAMRSPQEEKLNAALKLMNFLERDAPSMLGIMTELGMSGNNAQVRGEFREITLQLVAPLIEEILTAGIKSGEFRVRHPGETARLITLLALDVNEECMRMIVREYMNPECTLDVLEMLDTYRESIEQLVNARYGSIDLFEAGDIVSAIMRVINSLESK